MKKNNRIKKPIIIHILNFFLLAATFAVVALAIFMPKRMLKNKVDSELMQVAEVPDNYYLASQTATARTASKNLSSLDKIRLISGAWDSTMTKCAVTEGFLTSNEAVNLAKKQIDICYKEGIYPVSFSSEYDGWYSFETNLYKYTDNTFETYTAYLWEITFTKFDNSEYHTILISENGTILCAETNLKFEMNEDAYINYINEFLYPYDISSINNYNKDVILNRYPHIDISDATTIKYYKFEFETHESDTEKFIAFQYEKPDGYGFGLVSE